MSVFDWPEDDHCDWVPIAFLYIRPDEGRSVQFVRADEADPPVIPVSGYFDAGATLPVEAEDTGYSMNGVRLFATEELENACLVFDHHVERWPRQDLRLSCA